MLDWRNRTGVNWHYIAPGKPTQNAVIESFNVACATNSRTRKPSTASPRQSGESQDGDTTTTRSGLARRSAASRRQPRAERLSFGMAPRSARSPTRTARTIPPADSPNDLGTYLGRLTWAIFPLSFTIDLAELFPSYCFQYASESLARLLHNQLSH